MTKELYECIYWIINDIEANPNFNRGEILKRHKELLRGTNNEVSFYELFRKIHKRIDELKQQNPTESTAQCCIKRTINELEELLK